MKQHTLIIAEAGVNHNGSLELAKQLIDAAAEANVDYIKFQTFQTENLVSKNAIKAEYQRNNLADYDEFQYQMLKKLEFTPKQHQELIAHCQKKGIKFFSTAFDLISIDFLASLHLGLWKIPSGEIPNYLYLKKIAQKREPVILSTGMSTYSDIENALTVLTENGISLDQITVLHCNTEYPTPMKDVNLRAMLSIANRFHVKIGYSDHTKGIEVPIAAVALGATVIEKHFTLDRNLNGPDHKASLEPDELKEMVLAIRNIEMAMGSPEKKITPSEEKNIIAARKSIVASQFIKQGETFTENNLTVKRPGNGLSPMMWLNIIGKKATKNYQPDDLIEI